MSPVLKQWMFWEAKSDRTEVKANKINCIQVYAITIQKRL